MKQQDFIKQLENQAQKQAVLHEKRILPRQLDIITTFIGNYPWQVITFLSFLTALFLWLN